MSLTRPWRALVRLLAVPSVVLGLASLPSGGMFHPGSAPVQEAVLGRARRVGHVRSTSAVVAAVADAVRTTDAAGTDAVAADSGASPPMPTSTFDDRAVAGRLLQAASRAKPVRDSLATTLAWPLRGPITGRYGEPRGRSRHPGIDISAPIGSTVRAAAAGTVAAAGYVGGYHGYGLIVVVDHGNGMLTIYAHLSRAGVAIGQVVDTGDIVGASGCTGSCTGPHLHFEVRVGGSTRNPMDYLPS